jgi:hypothetical protein
LLLYSSHLPLGVPNGLDIQLGTTLFRRHQPAIKLFSGAVAGEEVEDFCVGSFSHAHPLPFLLFCFALLYLFYLHRFISKTQKKLESLLVAFIYLLLVLLK